MTNLTEEQKLYIKLHKQHVTTQQGLKEVFYKVPKIFWLGELYQGLSLESKIAYGILEDRKNVSIKNKWYDEKGKIYFIYTIEEFQQMLHVSKQKAINIKTELIKYGLLEQTKQGRGQPAKLYLFNPIATPSDEEKFKTSYQSNQETLPKNGTSQESEETESSSKKNEFNNTKPHSKGLKLRSLNFRLLKSRGLKNRLLEVQNLDPSNNNPSNNIINTNESYESEVVFDKRFLNYDKQGIPKNIVSILTAGVNDYKGVHERMGLLFKAKSSVLRDATSQGWKGTIVFEMFTEEDWGNLYQVLHACFCKIKTGDIQNIEKYLFQSLRNYFDNYVQNYYDRGVSNGD